MNISRTLLPGSSEGYDIRCLEVPSQGTLRSSILGMNQGFVPNDIYYLINNLTSFMNVGSSMVNGDFHHTTLGKDNANVQALMPEASIRRHPALCGPQIVGRVVVSETVVVRPYACMDDPMMYIG